jgi:hypothetical protein
VIADARDRPESDCDRVDSGRSRRPRLARTAVVQPLKGRLGFAPVGIRRTVPLKDLLNLPVRSRVDATGGSVRVTSARSGRGRQVATLSRGHFQVLQTRRRRALTDLVMKGGNFRLCRGASSAEGASAAQRRRSRRVIRRLKSRARGRFRTRGRYSAATVRGTDYEVIDRCDGTLTRVTRGRVAVRDLRRRRTVVVRAGRSYLARAPR